jgi:hypothetical protein
MWGTGAAILGSQMSINPTTSAMMNRSVIRRMQGRDWRLETHDAGPHQRRLIAARTPGCADKRQTGQMKRLRAVLQRMKDTRLSGICLRVVQQEAMMLGVVICARRAGAERSAGQVRLTAVGTGLGVARGLFQQAI